MENKARFAVGVSSYFLWTIKGATVMPLVRGSGFLIRNEGVRIFHKYHVITAGHVACPVQFPRVFGGSSPGLRAIGERHISTGLLVPRQRSGSSKPSEYPNTFPQTRFLNMDVAALHLKNEDAILGEVREAGVSPLEVDLDVLLQGEELEFHGVCSDETTVNPSDEDIQVRHCSISGVSHSAVVTHDYGTVTTAQLESELDPTMCGGPVVRKSNGKCVGVIVARVGPLKEEPSTPPSQDAATLVRKPWLDLSSTEGFMQHRDAHVRAAFVPLRDFLPRLRDIEI
jgi:hypothetical protein